LLPEAEIRCHQPYEGLLTVRMLKDSRLQVRVPEFTTAEQMEVRSSAGELTPRPFGNFLDLGDRQAGEVVTLRYPLPVMEEEVTIGNPGFRQYRYRVTWRGDTVVRMEPIGNDAAKGYSDFERSEVPLFYGAEGPSPLYRREQMRA